MFGVSFTEMVMIALVALVVFGPQRLPGMMRSLGEWIRRLRMLTTDLRAQSGIDDILREEGLEGGLTELRAIVRGEILTEPRQQRPVMHANDPYEQGAIDRWREYPPEGVDASGALPDDLLAPTPDAEAGAVRAGEQAGIEPQEPPT